MQLYELYARNLCDWSVQQTHLKPFEQLHLYTIIGGVCMKSHLLLVCGCLFGARKPAIRNATIPNTSQLEPIFEIQLSSH